MRGNRIAGLALCLGVAFLISTGSALAGTTAVTGGAVTYATEVGAVNAVYVQPGSPKNVTRALAVIRNTAQDFFVDITLGNGALFTGSGSSLPEASDLSITPNDATGAINVPVIISGGGAGSATVRYFIDVTTSYTGLATITINVAGWAKRDVANVIGSGGNLQITVETRDSATNVAFDSGTDTVTLDTGRAAVGAGTLTSTTATVDVATNRKNFVTGVNGETSLTNDDGAAITVTGQASSALLGLNGLPYTASSADTIQVVITGNLSGITWISVAGVAPVGITAGNVTAGSVTISVPGTTVLTAAAISIKVDGSTQLTSRELKLSSNFVSGLTGAAFASTQNHAIHASSTLTIWSLNGTILVANWVNGNNASLNARIYLWASANTGGNITARVFELPLANTTGTGVPIASVIVGTIGGLSGKNIRVVEDILVPGNITVPYQTNGGNLVIELTIEAVGVSGISQTFSGVFAYGTYPLSRIQ